MDQKSICLEVCPYMYSLGKLEEGKSLWTVARPFSGWWLSSLELEYLIFMSCDLYLKGVTEGKLKY